MQATTGCKINVSQASGADIEREIGLVGTSQSIAEAKNAIQEKVDQVVRRPVCTCFGALTNIPQKEKNNQRRSGGGGGGGGRDHRDRDYNDTYSHQQQQSSYGQHASQPNVAQQPTQGEGAAPDPYAIYGGYQNYLAMWYSSLGNQYQGAQPAGDQRPPGA
jgi:far upstream element-binding protein